MRAAILPRVSVDKSRATGARWSAVLNIFLTLLDKLGTTGAGIVMIIAGGVIVSPYFGVPAYVAQGIGWIAGGLAFVIFGRRWAVSEAEKRIENKNLPSSSAVPVIQAEITKLTTGK